MDHNPMAANEPQPIHPDIPVEKAWKIGRRVYVRCGFESTLNGQLREAGATWDRDVRALWVGTGKLDRVLPLVLAQVERVAAVTDIKSRGHWLTIPYDAADIRARAKVAGGVFDRERKQWALPDPQTLTEVTAAVDAWQKARKAAEAARHAAQIELVQAANAAEAVSHEEQVVTAAGRTLTGERGTAHGRLHGRMYRAEAEQRKPQPGTVERLKRGRWVLVLTSSAEFWGQDQIDDGLTPWGDPGAEPGWRYAFEYAVVEPTAEEAEQDRVEAAEEADLAEIEAVMRAARDISWGKGVDQLTRVEGAVIRADSPGGLSIHGGCITVTADGTVWYQHPGYYDDWLPSEVVITDPALVERVRAILAGGARGRGQYRIAGLV